MRDVEGMDFDKTIKELKKLYPAADDDDGMEDYVHGLGPSVPEAIRGMVQYKSAIEALGSMIWYVMKESQFSIH